jgi:hypothetical protein
MSETPQERRARLQHELEELDAQDAQEASPAEEQFADVLGQLDEDDGTTSDAEWGESFPLEPSVTFAGWWRGEDSWTGNHGPTPVYLLRDRDGKDVFIWGGRAQLDKKIANAAPQPGDRIAIRRLEDAPAEEGRNPAWRIRVAVAPGNGTMPEPDSDTLF